MALMVSGPVRSVHHSCWTHDQEGKSAGMRDTLGDTAHHPAWQRACSMCGHCDHIRAAEGLCPLAILRHPNDAGGDILIEGDRPGDRALKICDWPLTQAGGGGAEILSCLACDGPYALCEPRSCLPRTSAWTAATIWRALMPAASSNSTGVPEPGMDCTASLTTSGCRSGRLVKTSNTASPKPPSRQWSSTTTNLLPASCAAAYSVCASMTRTVIRSLFSCS